MKEKLLNIIKIIGYILALLIPGFLFIQMKIENKKSKQELLQHKEDEKNEIENTPAQDIIADSPNQSDIQSRIEQEQQELRERLRDRFNQTIQRTGSTTDN